MRDLQFENNRISLGADIEHRLQTFCPDPPTRLLLVDIDAQRLHVLDSGRSRAVYPVSTSRFGIDSSVGSFRTPRGIHRVARKIGENAPAGRIFRDRIDTGEQWNGSVDEENLILSRVLRLEGLEEGINRGQGIDSFDRCIYIHGTNREDLIGTPNSHGCICMKNSDIITLFDQVREGTIVVID